MNKSNDIPVQLSTVNDQDDRIAPKPEAGNDVTAREAAAKAAGAIPDGGLIAWLQVLGSFFLWWNTWLVES
jgi:hypothetical protein